MFKKETPRENRGSLTIACYIKILHVLILFVFYKHKEQITKNNYLMLKYYNINYILILVMCCKFRLGFIQNPVRESQ